MLPTYSLQFPTGTECLISRTRIRSYGSSKSLTPKPRALVDCGTLTELVVGVFAEKIGPISLDIEGQSLYLRMADDSAGFPYLVQTRHKAVSPCICEPHSSIDLLGCDTRTPCINPHLIYD